ncbi:hypothetical protein Trydic_g16019 [Trypoxylus dichotomus]
MIGRCIFKISVPLVLHQSKCYSSGFSINGKVALVTGGAAGLGLYFAKALLKNGLKGLGIGDINEQKGQQALKEIAQEFGKDKVFFLKMDVSKQNEVEELFKKTVDVFKKLDIVVNNAGILNDSTWERQMAININGTVYGCILAWNYLPKYRSSDEGIIVNLASITGLTRFTSIPLYSSTKHAVVGITRGIGSEHHYNRVKIRVVAICPGVTDTAMITDFFPENCLDLWRPAFKDDLPKWPHQQPEIVAECLIQAITKGTNGSLWVVNNSKIQNIPRLPEVLERPN